MKSITNAINKQTRLRFDQLIPGTLIPTCFVFNTIKTKIIKNISLFHVFRNNNCIYNNGSDNNLIQIETNCKNLKRSFPVKLTMILNSPCSRDDFFGLFGKPVYLSYFIEKVEYELPKLCDRF